MIPHLGFADAIIKGTLVIEDGYYSVEPTGSTQRLFLITSDPVVRGRLACLKHGDFISGTATRFTQTQVSIRSIDYVGLKDLEGTWRDEDEVFKFIDNRNFYYWDFNTQQNRFAGPYSYHYALSPYGENPDQCLWKIFIIDNVGVVLGSLEWSADDQIHLQLYDTDTGEISSNKHLIRSVFNNTVVPPSSSKKSSR